jgi:hypothetical protein
LDNWWKKQWGIGGDPFTERIIQKMKTMIERALKRTNKGEHVFIMAH